MIRIRFFGPRESNQKVFFGRTVIAKIVSICAIRFSPRRWSFLGLGAEKKWYLVSEDIPQDESDQMAVNLMVTLAESGHPRATSPLFWKVPLLCRPGDDYHCFSHKYFCKSAQSLLCSRRKCVKHMNLIPIGRRDALWDDSRVLRLCQVRSRQTCFWIMMILNKKFLFATILRTNWKRQIEQILYWCRIPDYCWSRTAFHDKGHWRVSQFTDAAACCEYILPRDEEASAPKSWIRGNTKSGPVLEVTTHLLAK